MGLCQRISTRKMELDLRFSVNPTLEEEFSVSDEIPLELYSLKWMLIQ